jgi:mitotic spindle assembly checkpoint protein MAD2
VFADIPDTAEMSSKETSKSKDKDKDKSKVHKLSLKGSARLVAEFVRLIAVVHESLLTVQLMQFQYSIHSILYETNLPTLCDVY